MKRQYKREQSQSSERSRHKHKHRQYSHQKRKKHRRQSRSSSREYRQNDRSRHKHIEHKSKRQRQNQQQYTHREGRNYTTEGGYDTKNKDQPAKQQIIKQKPCWQPSGILLHFYNARDGVSLKFNQPPQSRDPVDSWRIFIFKGEQVLQPINLTNSCYLIGKDDRVCDILCQNQSISRQHAVIQFRLVIVNNEDGTFTEIIKPYLMDLQSTNGTILNDAKIQPSRYVELLHKDILKFGFSERQYVMVKDESAVAGRKDEEEE